MTITDILNVLNIARYIKNLLQKISKIKLSFGINRDIIYFEKRSDSDELMISELTKATSVIFIGTSHRKLAGFLEKVFDRNSKLKEIKVLYACDKDGEARDKNFRQTMLTSIKNIGNIIGSESVYYKLSENFNLSFHQMTYNCYFNGCRIDNDKFFISHQIYSKGIEAEEEHTIFFKKNHITEKELGRIFKCYNEAFDTLYQRSNYLGRFHKDLWNLSVREWNTFINKSEAYKSSMKDVLKILKEVVSNSKEEKLRVMEVCSGTGQLVEMLIEEFPNFEIFFIDKSPKMINFCESKEKIKNRTKGGYILDVTDTAIHFDFFKELFNMDVIICHISLPIPEIGIENFKNFLVFCQKFLKDDGYLILSLLNTTIQISGDKYNLNNDPLRTRLMALRKRSDKRKTKTLIPKEDFEMILKELNFDIEKCVRKSYPFDMEQRINMWHTPAILDTLLDYERIDKNKLKEEFLTLKEELITNKTPDMIVMHYLLKVNKSSTKRFI